MKYKKLKKEIKNSSSQSLKVIDILFNNEIESNSGLEKTKWTELKKRYDSGKETREDAALLILELKKLIVLHSVLVFNELVKEAIYNISDIVKWDMECEKAGKNVKKPARPAAAEVASEGFDKPAAKETAPQKPIEIKETPRKTKKRMTRKTRVIVGIILLVICVIEVIGVLSGNLTVDEGTNIVFPLIIMTALFGGGGLFFLLWRDKK